MVPTEVLTFLQMQKAGGRHLVIYPVMLLEGYGLGGKRLTVLADPVDLLMKLEELMVVPVSLILMQRKNSFKFQLSIKIAVHF